MTTTLRVISSQEFAAMSGGIVQNKKLCNFQAGMRKSNGRLSSCQGLDSNQSASRQPVPKEAEEEQVYVRNACE